MSFYAAAGTGRSAPGSTPHRRRVVGIGAAACQRIVLISAQDCRSRLGETRPRLRTARDQLDVIRSAQRSFATSAAVRAAGTGVSDGLRRPTSQLLASLVVMGICGAAAGPRLRRVVLLLGEKYPVQQSDNVLVDRDLDRLRA